MKEVSLYHLFIALRGEKRLTGQGIGEYMLFQELLDKGFPLDKAEDLLLVFETLWIKSRNEQQVFRELFRNWQAETKNYILEQKADWEKIIKEIGKIKPKSDPKPQPVAPVVPSPVIPPDPGNEAQQKPAGINGTDPPAGREPDTKLPPAGEPDGDVSISLGQRSGPDDMAVKPSVTAASLSPDTPSRTFLLGNEYFPVANRYLRQNWRNLKNRQEINEFADIDLQATITGIAKTGQFWKFEYQKKTQNLLSLFIFLDQGGSMAAAEAFGKELTDSALESGAHSGCRPYYFYNLPAEGVYAGKKTYILYNEDQTESFPIASLFGKLNKNNIVVLVYSDAGALRGARGEIAEKRKEQTKEFLRYLMKTTAYTAWLNPVPRDRWKGTCAQEIALAFDEMPMFEATGKGIEQAVNVLKGKTFVNQ